MDQLQVKFTDDRPVNGIVFSLNLPRNPCFCRSIQIPLFKLIRPVLALSHSWDKQSSSRLLPDHVVPKLPRSPDNMAEPDSQIWVLAPDGPLPNLTTLTKILTPSETLFSHLQKRDSDIYPAYFLGCYKNEMKLCENHLKTSRTMQVAALQLCSSQHSNTTSPVLCSYFYILDFCGKISTLCILKGGASTHKGSFVLPASWKDFSIVRVLVL